MSITFSPESPKVGTTVKIGYSDSDGGFLRVTSPATTGFFPTDVGSGSQDFPVSYAGSHKVDLFSSKKKGRKFATLSSGSFEAGE